MTRSENFYEKKEADGSRFEKTCWILFIVICLILGITWKREALILLIVPIVRVMFFDWKKENEYINSE